MRSRISDFPSFYFKLKNLTSGDGIKKNSITHMDFYFEDLFDDISNVVIVFQVSY